MTPGNLRAAMYAFSSLIMPSLETMSKILIYLLNTMQLPFHRNEYIHYI